MLHFIQNFIENVPFFSSLPVAFDLGTHTTKIGVRGKGVVLREPSSVAFKMQPREYMFFGTEAKSIMGKTPEFLKVTKPVVGGIISDFDSEVALIRFFLEKSVYPYLRGTLIKPALHGVAAVPPTATEIEQKAVEEAILKAGCSSVDMIKKPLATAAGLGINVFYHEPHCLVDIGAGLIELSIVSGGGIVAQRTLKQAGDAMDRIIMNYIHLKHGVVLGEATCERLKISSLTFDTAQDKTELVRGKSLENGLPKSIKIRSSELREALTPTFNLIIENIRELLELSPPEVVNDIYREGIALAGKGSSIPNLNVYMQGELHIDVHVPEHAAEATIYGLLRLMQQPEQMRLITMKTA